MPASLYGAAGAERLEAGALWPLLGAAKTAVPRPLFFFAPASIIMKSIRISHARPGRFPARGREADSFVKEKYHLLSRIHI